MSSPHLHPLQLSYISASARIFIFIEESLHDLRIEKVRREKLLYIVGIDFYHPVDKMQQNVS